MSTRALAHPAEEFDTRWIVPFAMLCRVPSSERSAVIRRLILRRVTLGVLGGRRPPRGTSERGYDVEGTAVESEPEQLP